MQKIILIIAALVTTACSQDKLGKGVMGALTSGSQTANCKPVSAKATLSQTAVSKCKNPQDYICNHRIFSPDAIDHKTTVQECLATSGMGQFCYSVSTSSFNTKAAAQNADSSAVEPGGEYNYHEYTCHHSKMKDFAQGTSGAPGDSLSHALDNSVAKCLARAGAQ